MMFKKPLAPFKTVLQCQGTQHLKPNQAKIHKKQQVGLLNTFFSLFASTKSPPLNQSLSLSPLAPSVNIHLMFCTYNVQTCF
jgi:hypothetical protein